MVQRAMNEGWNIPKQEKRNKEELYILDHNKLSPEMQDIRNRLDEYVIGQDDAKDQIIDALARTMIPNPNRKKPIANLVFLGPTWTGKTEIPRALGKIFFNDEFRDLRETKIDCNNFQHDHEVAELIGAPVWYVWYGDEPRFADTNIFKKFRETRAKWNLHPLIQNFDDFAIVIFDEIEKAHDSLYKLLLNIFDEWVVALKSWWETDTGSHHKWKKEVGHSKYTNFKNVIIIMTSNLWANEIQEKLAWKWTMWFATKPREEVVIPRNFYENKLKDHFAPEFVWRITEFVPFKALTKDELHQRLDLEVLRHKKYLWNIIDFSLSQKTSDFLVNKAYDSNLWWRNLITEYEKDITTMVSRIIWNWEIWRAEAKKWKSVKYIEIDMKDDSDSIVKDLDKFIAIPHFSEQQNKERFTRRVKKSTTNLHSDEIILSLKSWSLLELLKDVIIPDIEYLKILYTERDNFIKDYEAEIEVVEERLLSCGLPKKDLSLVANNTYRTRFEELQEMFTTLSGIKLWTKDLDEQINLNMRVVRKITETFLKYNIYLVNWWAGRLEEITETINTVLENNFKRKLNNKEVNLMINVIYKEYLANHSTHSPRTREERKAVNNQNKVKKELEKQNTLTSEANKPKQELVSDNKDFQTKTPINVTINLNFYWDNNWEKDWDRIKKLLETRANLFQDKYNQVMLAVKQSIDNRENDNDLVLVFDEVREILKKELWKLTSNQSQVINSLIQEALKNK